jgi:hypothetical protein
MTTPVIENEEKSDEKRDGFMCEYFFNPLLWRFFIIGEKYIQGVSKRALQIWKRIEIYTEDIHNVLNCQNVAKHTEFYLG